MSLKVTMNADKFGYYQVGDLKTYSKLEAIEWQRRFGHFPEWNFNREVFDSCNWKTEPDIDLWELYKARARQIRASYDYVVIFYSGGSDSHNLLSAWIDAGLKIDEVLTYWNYEGSKSKDDIQNSEPDRVVFPHIKQLQDRGIDFQFRLVDSSSLEIKALSQSDLAYSINCNFTPATVFKNYLRTEIDDYRNIIASGKKLCFVLGIDKPQIFFDAQGHYLQFFDFMDIAATPEVQRNYDKGFYDEMFYYTPDMPEIMIKQAHIIKRFVETCHNPKFYQTKSTKCGYNIRLNQYLTDATLKQLIYPRWNNDTFQSGKSGMKFFSKRFQWMWDGNIEEKNRYFSAGHSLFNNLGDYWVNDPKDITKGVKGHASPKYYI